MRVEPDLRSIFYNDLRGRHPPRLRAGPPPMHHPAMHKHTTLPFGVVAIIGGRYRDKVGYYDDNDGDKLMVYLGTPLLSEVAFVSRTEARSATAEEDRAWRAQHPGLEEYEAASKNLRDQRR